MREEDSLTLAPGHLLNIQALQGSTGEKGSVSQGIPAPRFSHSWEGSWGGEGGDRRNVQRSKDMGWGSRRVIHTCWEME